MSFNTFTRLKAKPDHIEKVKRVLSDGVLRTPQEIVPKSNLSLTQVKCVLNELEKDGAIKVIRQERSPRVRVSM